jgi:argininosuccinate lyase
VRWCIANKRTLQDMTIEEYRTFDERFDDDITQVVQAKACANARTSFGGASQKSVKQNIRSIYARLKKYYTTNN